MGELVSCRDMILDRAASQNDPSIDVVVVYTKIAQSRKHYCVSCVPAVGSYQSTQEICHRFASDLKVPYAAE
jgi:hypothetical protein